MIITVANQKGGVGKTDVSVNLSSCIAEKGKKVLLIDLDPQGNATTYLSGKEFRKTSSNLISDENIKIADVIQKTSVKNLSIIPGDQRLNAATVDILNDVGMQFKLKRKIKNLRGFDHILIDTPPSLGPLTINALAASSGVIVPIQVHHLATEGMEKLISTVSLMKKEINPKLDVFGYVLTMYDKRNKLSGSIEEIIRQRFKQKVFSSMIPVNVDLAAAPREHMPIIQHAKESRGAYAYRNLAKEFLRR
jgi:chromosome partitioning protein